MKLSNSLSEATAQGGHNCPGGAPQPNPEFCLTLELNLLIPLSSAERDAELSLSHPKEEAICAPMVYSLQHLRAGWGRGDRDVEAGGDGQGMLLPGATAKQVECARANRRGERGCYPMVTFPLVRPPETFHWESPV